MNLPAVNSLNPWACTWFLIGTFTLAGLAHTLWLKTAASARWAVPLDGGATFRGRRLFGGNKTFRGFLVMVPAAGVAFGLVARVVQAIRGDLTLVGLWGLSPPAYSLLGLWAGLGFMAGELPNSFLKRQLGVAPGAAPSHPLLRPLCFLLDRIDSILGMLAALSLFVATPWRVWAGMLLVGPGIHWLFSVVLFRLRVKARPA